MGTAGASQIEVRDPGRFDDVVGTVRASTPDEVEHRVRSAETAARTWEAMGVETRAELLLSAAAAFDDVDDELVRLLTRENGAVMAVSRRDISTIPSLLRMAVELGLAQLTRSPEIGDGIRLRRRPYGVIACIIPWNSPIVLALQKVGPALVAGNTVVVKPSPGAPLAVTHVLETIAMHLPAGVLSVVNGGGDVGVALVDHRAVRKVSFTGGEAVAREIMRLAARTFTRVHFELGGNDGALVLDDADLEKTASAIVSQAFRRSGQVCFAIKRVYVPRQRLNDFTDASLASLSQFLVGHGLDPASTMGPVNNAARFDHIQRLHADLRSHGAQVEMGGVRLAPESWDQGWYLQPALVRDADPADEIVLTEQFGPILPIIGYDDEATALAQLNSTEFGLCASVWSSDVERATAMAERTEAGITFVNTHALDTAARMALPFGGIKQSGIGWEGSAAGIDEFLQYHGLRISEETQ